MEFETRFNTILPKLQQIAVKYSGLCRYTGPEDLFAEMRSYLWNEWKQGDLENKTDSYIVQACYFYIRNYLRTVKDPARLVSIQESLASSEGAVNDSNENEFNLLGNIIPDGLPGINELIESKQLYEKIMNNGLSTLEKDIVRYLYNGYTVREIAKILGLSHVMVVKHKKYIAEKVTSNYGNLLV